MLVGCSWTQSNCHHAGNQCKSWGKVSCCCCSACNPSLATITPSRRWGLATVHLSCCYYLLLCSMKPCSLLVGFTICMEHADAQNTAGLHIYTGFVMQQAGPRYVNHSRNANDLSDICPVVICTYHGCSFVMSIRFIANPNVFVHHDLQTVECIVKNTAGLCSIALMPIDAKYHTRCMQTPYSIASYPVDRSLKLYQSLRQS